jgi:signal transduction histidine kinase
MINNAKDALSTSSVDLKLIFITISIENTYAKVSIYDNAGGIKSEILNKIFEPYFTTKNNSQGTGIGLYMSNEIITKHMNGEIRVSNKKFEFNNIEYKGALFEIIIPI